MKRPALPDSLVTSILCPVDFSDHSRVALQYALAMASRFKARVAALFVNDPLLMAAAAQAFTPAALERTSLKELRAFVDRTSKMTGDTIKVSCEITQGDPATEIGRAVTRRKADLIVLGTQGLSGGRKFVFGSTTERVLRDARVPVLAVPPTAGVTARTGWPGRKVLAAVDVGPRMASDVRAAAAVARAFNADLLIVHVLKPIHAPGWLTARAVSDDEARLAGSRDALERVAQTLDPALTVECRVVSGTPDEAIPAIAAATRTGLIVVTLRAERGWFGTPQGSVTYETLVHSTTPVLALAGRTAKRSARP
jgi:nucleotide-binding universal stress UspA family protein